MKKKKKITLRSHEIAMPLTNPTIILAENNGCFILENCARLVSAIYDDADGCNRMNYLLAKLCDEKPSFRDKIVQMEQDGDQVIVRLRYKRFMRASDAVPKTRASKIIEEELIMPLPPKPFDYRAYLLSDEWKSRSLAAKERSGHKCQVCNSSDRLHAHHRTYERIGNESPDDLIVLCQRCHSLFHHKSK